MSARLRCFLPIADRRSKLLILGTMPGPTALRVRQYYGFPGNQFWRIMSEILGVRPRTYREKVRMLKSHGIALWDTLAECTRPSALDSHIRGPVPNDVSGLLERYRGIRAVFVNGGGAETYFRRFFAARTSVPAVRLPSTSPANAGTRYPEKLARWRAALLPWIE